MSRDSRYLASFRAKWPKELEPRGFIQIPKCLFTCATDLGLSAREFQVLSVLIEKCWYAGDRAYPKINTIASSVGKSNSTVREILKDLETKGFISKQRRFNSSNIYDLKPSAEKLVKHLEDCSRFRAGTRAKAGGMDSYVSGDYIEADISRIKYKDSNLSCRQSHLSNVVEAEVVEEPDEV